MARFAPQLFECDFAVGVTSYEDHYPGETPQSARIVLSIQIEDAAESLIAIVDTGAPWCVFDPNLVASLGIDEEYQPEERISIRGTFYRGRLARVPIRLIADEGEDLSIEATVFVPELDGEEWRNPNFIGIQGCLSRIRFGIDPGENMFYFSPL